MARGTTHAAKPEGQRRRRNAPTTPGEREFRDEGRTYGPTIEAATLQGDWPPAVVRWWEAWRRQPQAVSFQDTDWQRLADLAPLRAMLLDDLSPGERVKILGEVRMNEERLGATYTDRRRAGIRITRDESAEDSPGLASVTPIASARARWAAASDDDDTDD